MSYAKGENHGQAKLSNKDVLEIRKLLSEKVRVKAISIKFNVCRCTVWKIKKKITWKELP
jgi:DNA invertase Pin-like site-specific DNA recombinase